VGTGRQCRCQTEKTRHTGRVFSVRRVEVRVGGVGDVSVGVGDVSVGVGDMSVGVGDVSVRVGMYWWGRECAGGGFTSQ